MSVAGVRNIVKGQRGYACSQEASTVHKDCCSESITDAKIKQCVICHCVE